MSVDVSAFQSAFGQLCDLSARALHDGASRDTVLRAFQGQGHELPDVLRARVNVNHHIAVVKRNGAKAGDGERTLARSMVVAGRKSREWAEVEWCVSLPIVNPNP